MKLQPSLIIWTVICFCLLMLVLDRLLFRPLLQHMDRRSERVKGAKRLAVEAAEKEREEALRLAKEEQAKKLAEAARAREKAEQLRRESEERLKALSRELDEKKAREENELAGLTEGCVQEISSRLDELAEAYAERLVADGRH